MVIKRAIPITKRVVTFYENWLERHYLVFVVLILGALVINEIYLFGIDITRWDYMLVTGAIVFALGLRIALDMPKKTDEALTRLVNRGAVQATPERLADFKQMLDARADQWAHRGGLFVAAAILIAFLVAFGTSLVLEDPTLPLLEVVGGYVAGRYLGRAASFQGLGRLLRQEKIALKVQPGHLDGAAGFKPVGELFFFQAMVLAIPALFLAVWWLIIPSAPDLNARYAIWRDPYLGLLAIVLLFEVSAFVIPMWFFHQEMADQKNELLKNADELSQRVAALQAALADATTDQERKLLKDRLADMTERYWALEQMPTWPLDVKTRRRFTINNVALFLPLASQFFNVTGFWGNLLKGLPDILNKLNQ
jgi:hypothetical protein